MRKFKDLLFDDSYNKTLEALSKLVLLISGIPFFVVLVRLTNPETDTLLLALLTWHALGLLLIEMWSKKLSKSAYRNNLKLNDRSLNFQAINAPLLDIIHCGVMILLYLIYIYFNYDNLRLHFNYYLKYKLGA